MIKRPEDIKAEHAIIKTVFIEPELFPKVRETLSARMFSNEANRAVFDALRRMHDDSIALDQVALKGYLNSNYNRIGGDNYLNNINSMEVLPTNIDQYVHMVKDTYMRRSVIDAGLDIAESALHGQNADTAVGKLLTYSDRLAGEMAGNSEIISMSELAALQLPAFHSKVKDPGLRGIRTGIDSYDYVIGGLGRGDEVLIAGRPGAGKTSLLLTILHNQANFGIPVALFSYEMGPEQIFKRLLAIDSGVSHKKIDMGHVKPDELARVEASFKRVSALPFYMTYSLTMGIDEIANMSTKLHKSHGVEVAALDYIQLLSTKEDNQNNELGRISRVLKLNAQRNDMAWLVASQLNRRVEYRDNKRPVLSDLRDSGNLEQDADIVLMVYRDFMYNPNSENAGLAEILTRKNRHGPLANFILRFEQETMAFYSMNS